MNVSKVYGTFLNFRAGFAALYRAVPQPRVTQRVLIKQGQEQILFTFPKKIDGRDPDVQIWTPESGNGKTEHLPTFDSLETYARFVGHKIGAYAAGLVESGIMPLFQQTHRCALDSPDVLSELTSTAAALGKQLVFLDAEKLVVLVDSYNNVNHNLGFIETSVAGRQVVIPIFPNSERLMMAMEDLNHPPAGADPAAAAAQARADALRRFQLLIDAEPVPPTAIAANNAATISLSNVFGRTDVGRGNRTNNEDAMVAVVLPDDRIILVVADGMGGHGNGEVASAMAVRYLPAAIKYGLSLTEAVDYARTKVMEGQDTLSQWERRGTTVVAALISGGQAELVSVGDSPIYLVKKDGRRLLLTPPESGPLRLLMEYDLNILEMLSRVEPEIHAHLLSARARQWVWPLTDQALEEFEDWVETIPRPKTALGAAYAKNVIHNALGHGRGDINFSTTITLEPGDKLLLCTDGLPDAVKVGRTLAEVLAHDLPVEELGNTMVEHSLEAQEEHFRVKGKRSGDNVTVLVFEQPGEPVEEPTAVMPAALIKLANPPQIEATLADIANFVEPIPPQALTAVRARLSELASDTDVKIRELAALALAMLE